MIHNYTFLGYYYTINKFKFRKYLEIKLNTTSKIEPDLLVIMMNPGGSFPINNDDNERVLTIASPDATQKQIVKIMEAKSFEYARVLNLSDYREADSREFYKMIPEFNSNNIDHSIFDSKREKDFNSLFIKNIPVIFAWGVNKKLNKLAKQAIKIVSEKKCEIIGFKKKDFDFAYYHPLPRNIKSQERWIEEILRQI